MRGVAQSAVVVDSLGPVSGEVNDCEEVGITSGRGERANQINVEYVEVECGCDDAPWMTGRRGRCSTR